MNKFKWSMITVLALVTLLATATLVNAQTETPQTPEDGTGFGFSGGRGHHMMWNFNYTGTQSGLLHDEILPILAEKLAVTVDELNTRLEAGERMSEIAFSLGYSFDEFRVMMLDARSQALDLAVEEGTITQEQSEWMEQRGGGQMMGGNGRNGQSQYANPDCPYYQSNP